MSGGETNNVQGKTSEQGVGNGNGVQGGAEFEDADAEDVMQAMAEEDRGDGQGEKDGDEAVPETVERKAERG